MATFVKTVNAGAYYLNGVPYAGGGGGGGGGLGVPLFAVLSNHVLDSTPVTTVPPVGSYLASGFVTAPYLAANKMSLVHGFNNSNGALSSPTNSVITFDCDREGMYNFTFSISGQGTVPDSYQGILGVFITQNGKSVAFNSQKVIGTNTVYSDRISVSVDTYLMPTDVVQFGVIYATPAGTDSWVIDSMILTGTLLNHPPA